MTELSSPAMTFLVYLLSFFGPASAAQAPDLTPEGTWRVISLHQDGNPTPLNGETVTVRNGHLELNLLDRDGRPSKATARSNFRPGTFTLSFVLFDPAKPVQVAGNWKREGNRLIACYQHDGEAPTPGDFRPGPGKVVWVLERLR